MFVRIHSGPSCLPVPPKKISTKKIFLSVYFQVGKAYSLNSRNYQFKHKGHALLSAYLKKVSGIHGPEHYPGKCIGGPYQN